MKIVFDRLCNAALNGQACPSNDELRKGLPVRSLSTVSNLVSELHRDGLIVVRRWGRERSVFIVPTGHATAGWDGILAAKNRSVTKADTPPKSFDKTIIDGSRALHRALWREHPEIMKFQYEQGRGVMP